MVKRKPEEEEENEENEDSTLQDGQRHRVPLYMKDGAINPELTPTQRAKAQTEDAVARKFGLTDARQLHRPGFRYNMDHAAFERTRQAYALADQEAANAWKGGAAVTVRGDAPRKDAALTDARAEAYRLYDEEMANAWRGPNRQFAAQHLLARGETIPQARPLCFGLVADRDGGWPSPTI